MKKYHIIIFLCGLLCAATMTVRAQSGPTGILTWNIADGTLTISGDGAMPNYGYVSSSFVTSAPWGIYRDSFIDVVINNGVTHIGNDAFYGCSNITSVTIPESVITIGNNAFRNCNRLAFVTIPENVTSIGNYAFKSCGSISVSFNATNCTTMGNFEESVFDDCSVFMLNIGDNVTRIPDNAFYGCSGYTSVTIPESVTYIGEYAFAFCRSLTSVTIPEGITTISKGVFWYCDNLISVNIPNSIISISDNMFSNCSSLTSITIPENITTIGDQTFSGCVRLVSVIIPDGVISIGDGAFNACRSFTAVTIPNSVKSIGDYAFSACIGLTSVAIPESVTSIGIGAFEGCSGLSSVTIPQNITSISTYMFADCMRLTSVTIPESVTSIGNWAFRNCSGLTSVTIPTRVTSIGSYAFDYCSSLTAVFNMSAIPQNIGGFYNVFNGIWLRDVNLYVPELSIEAHQNAAVWQDFKQILPLLPVAGISLNKSTTALTANDTEHLTATVTPGTATNQAVTWSSDNTNVATVSSDGIITAQAAGTATITATTQEGYKTAYCTVTVTAATYVNAQKPIIIEHPQSGNYAPSSGAPAILTVSAFVTDGGTLSYQWYINSTNSATGVTSGTPLSGATGTSYAWPTQNLGARNFHVVVTNTNNNVNGTKTATTTSEIAVITVAIVEVTDIILNKTALSLVIGDTEYLEATIEPDNAFYNFASWSTNNPSVATVSSYGLVTAVGVGTATITVTTYDGGKTASCSVTVTVPAIPLITISTPPAVITTFTQGNITGSLTVAASATPSAALSYQWYSNTSSSNMGGAVVSGATDASFTIPATLTAGTYYYFCEVRATNATPVRSSVATVTVTIPQVLVTGVTLNKTALTLAVGGAEQLTATVSPSNAANKGVSWMSSDPSKAFVSDNGTVTATAAGVAVIVVTTHDGGKSATCTVTVSPLTSVEIPDNAPLAHVYPNPTDGMITLEFEAEGNYMVTLADINGKALLHESLTGQTAQIDISGYPAGVYLLTIDDGKWQNTVRVVKN